MKPSTLYSFRRPTYPQVTTRASGCCQDSHRDFELRCWLVRLKGVPTQRAARLTGRFFYSLTPMARIVGYMQNTPPRMLSRSKVPIGRRAPCLPIFELGSVSAGATICHDHYLGLLPRFLAKQGALVWVNPSFDNVIDIKWSSVLRLRAVENRFFALCTLHDSTMKRTRTHPFAFSPDGKELMARQVGYAATRRLSECKEPGTIYVVDLDMSALGKPLDWSRIPWPKKPKTPRPNPPGKPVRTKMSAKRPAIYTVAGWQNVGRGQPAETDQGLVYVGVIREAAILDAAECFQVLGEAEKNNAVPIIWNLWNELPTHSPRMALLMMGRAIECCAPILISDRAGIHEVVELANRIKIPVRRPIEPSGEAIVDLNYAWGLRNAFKIVASNLPSASAVGHRKAHKFRRRALERYQSLA